MTYAPPTRHGFHPGNHHHAHGGSHHHAGGAAAAAQQEETFNAHDLHKSLEEREDLDEDIKELTSRYFLQRDNLYKKLHMGNQTSSGADHIGIKTSSISHGGSGPQNGAGANAFDVLTEKSDTVAEQEGENAASTAVDDDEDGWISVGPKHHTKDHHHSGGWGGHGHGHHGHHAGHYHGRRSFGGADRDIERRRFHRKLDEEQGTPAEEDQAAQ